MAKYQSFEELPVWREGARLYNCVLDLLEKPNLPLSASFCHQLDRAALSISNNIAEGFERTTIGELLSFLAIARGSRGEVRSMTLVIKNRPKMDRFGLDLNEIGTLAKSCVRQLTAWISSVEASGIQGKRHLDARRLEMRRVAQAAKDFRIGFLKNLKPDHPLYHSAEARAARGESLT